MKIYVDMDMYKVTDMDKDMNMDMDRSKKIIISSLQKLILI
jgi:hypothetical protein